MPEGIANHFVFPKFTASGKGTLKEVIDNDTITRYKITLNVLGVEKGESGGVSMMLKTGMDMSQDYTVFDNRPPIPQKDIKPQDRTIVA